MRDLDLVTMHEPCGGLVDGGTCETCGPDVPVSLPDVRLWGVDPPVAIYLDRLRADNRRLRRRIGNQESLRRSLGQMTAIANRRAAYTGVSPGAVAIVAAVMFGLGAVTSYLFAFSG